MSQDDNTLQTLRVAVRRFGPFETAIVAQFEDFVRVSGSQAHLHIEPMDLNPLHQRLFVERELANGTWDLAFLSTDWIAEAQSLGLVENLLPFQQRAPIADFPSAWSPSLVGLQQFAGGLWGLPYHDGPECLIYRTDLLAEAGIAVPETWDEFHAAARRLHSPEQDGTVMALFPDGHNSFYDFCIHIWTRGGEPFDEAARPSLRTSEARAALDFIRTLASDGTAVAANLRELDSVQAGLRFCDGKVAMMVNWFGFAALGDTGDDSRVKGKVGIAPIPKGEGGRSVSLNVFWLLAMAAGSRHKALAWDFMRHCATAPMDKLTTQLGAIGTRLSTWHDADVNRLVPYYHQLEALHRNAREMPRHPRLAEISHAIDRMITAAVTTEAPSDDLLARAQAEIEEIVR